MWPPVYSRPPLSPSVDTSQHTQLRGISLHAGGSLFNLWDGNPKGKKLALCDTEHVPFLQVYPTWKRCERQRGSQTRSRYPCRCAASYRGDPGGELETLQSELVEAPVKWAERIWTQHMKEAERAVGLEQGAAARSCTNLASVLQQQEARLEPYLQQ